MFAFEEDQNPTEALLQTFRRHASGVAVITTTTDGKPIGFTATSMTSLGATPPLVMFSVASGASSFEPMVRAEYVAVHTLGASNLELSQRMSSDHEQRFVPKDWHFGPHGVPVLEAATSVLIGRVREVLNIEKNAVVILEIITGAVGDDDTPLVYHRRAYATTGEPLSTPKV